MDPIQLNQARVTRRQLFGKTATGLGIAALSSLIKNDALAGNSNAPAIPGYPTSTPHAKRVIYLWQGGGPSHVDLFDPKPLLQKMAMQDLPESIRGTTRLSTMTSGNKAWPIIPALKPFRKNGKSGIEISDMLPHTAAIADDLCLIRSMNTEAVNHAPGVTFFLTGSQIPGRPSLGAWTTYGLGSESEDLPAFVVMTSSDRQKSCGQLFFDYYWGSGFLPSRYQGVRFRSTGDPVPYLTNPNGVSQAARRSLLDDIRSINQAHLADYGDPEIDTRISQYEMAYRMQTSVPDLLDLSDEPQHILDLYGPDVLEKGSFANNCLMARRLIERGTRFVQLMHAGWDQHNNLHTQLAIQCKDTDQPSAALVTDLKQRGLLDDTLVIWGGEFGRTPFGQGDPTNPKGRDHFGKAFSLWMAGGGVKAGHVHGATDDFAWNITQDPVHVHDHQATILHLLGIDHTKLTYRYQGRQFRLTDVHGHVVKGILA
ncbi:DUF1501 domain-containing protein [Phragmitibacter flavus]|uniref:DUF1501 domain-containing protein n=1 Tax=Phragmitibacter flavus TaxID=2576071 RepID=A0A5R8K8T7_9BACT|nr:DUF1501 domain-containing protein [Phragmitibacter flavus]TLD68728.1 DUF1501 domain-containing protein [Phragmitibacter flavus]